MRSLPAVVSEPGTAAPGAELLAKAPGAEAGMRIAAQIIWSRECGEQLMPEHRTPTLEAIAGFRFLASEQRAVERKVELLEGAGEGQGSWMWPQPVGDEESDRAAGLAAAEAERVHAIYQERVAKRPELVEEYPLGILARAFQERAPVRIERSSGEGGVLALSVGAPSSRKGQKGVWRRAEGADVAITGGMPRAGVPVASLQEVSAGAVRPKLEYLPSPERRLVDDEMDRPVLKRSALLEMYDAPSSARGGMPLTPRLAHEVLLSLGGEGRSWSDSPVVVSFAVKELRRRMWPNSRRRGRRELEQLLKAWMLLRTQGAYWYYDARVRRPRLRFLIDVREFETKDLDFWVHLPPESTAGSWIHCPTLRALGPESARSYRAYLTVSEWWDRYLTQKGRMFSPQRIKVLRNADGLLLDAKGEVLMKPKTKDTPEKLWKRGQAVIGDDGKPVMERNPEMDRLPEPTRENLIEMTHASISDDPAVRCSQYARAVRAVEALTKPSFARDGRKLREAVVTLERGPARSVRRGRASGKEPIRRIIPKSWIVMARQGKEPVSVAA